MAAHHSFFLKDKRLCYERESEPVSEVLRRLLSFGAKKTFRDGACFCIDVSSSSSSCIFCTPEDEIATISTEDSWIYIFWASDPEGRNRLVLWEEMDNGTGCPDEQKLLVVDEESEDWQALPISKRKVRMFKSPAEAQTAFQDVNRNIGS
ncbi:MAG: hypothetical protein WCT28_00150 [Patescibacteria group bacterium]|jgi:hypothetical protein